MTATLQPPTTPATLHGSDITDNLRSSTLEIDVLMGGSALRFGRTMSSMVNNTPMSLYEVLVGDEVAYPVSRVVTARGPVVLRLRMRNTSRCIDALAVEEVVEIVSRTAQVLDVRTGA